MLPSLLDFLRHIIDECEYLQRAVGTKDKNDILNDETLSRAIVRSLEIIGEATKKLPADLGSNTNM